LDYLITLRNEVIVDKRLFLLMMTLDEQYLLAPARYVDLNPARARLAKRAEEKHERTGRPLGGDNFLSLLEEKSGRISIKQKPCPKKNDNQVRCRRNSGVKRSSPLALCLKRSAPQVYPVECESYSTEVKRSSRPNASR